MRAGLVQGVLVLWLAACTAHAQSTPDNTGLKLNPAEGPLTPAYKEGLETRNEQRREEAKQKGRTHVDVIPPAGQGGEVDVEAPPDVTAPTKIEADGAPEEAAPASTGARAAEPVERVREGPEGPEAARQDSQAGGLDGILAELVKALNRETDIRRVRYARSAREAPAGVQGSAPDVAAPLPRVGAGDAFYARVLHSVNSDYPGPVLVQVLQPPIAGSVARGEFQLVRDRMVIRLSSLDVEGESVPIDAVAVGLDCGCFGVSGDVSYHWWDRVLLPAAAGFVEQYLIARAETDRRVVQGDGGTIATEQKARTARQARDAGLAAVAGRVGQVLLEQAPSSRTVVIPRNAEVAVMFAERLARRAEPRGGVVQQRSGPAPPSVERVSGGTDAGGQETR